jgi:tetratricopeptide (TPR) repeat protein
MAFMGAKQKRNQQAPDQLFARAKRELANGDSKEALKNAKVCYRAQASPEHRQLLEQAHVARIQQLRGRGLVSEAVAVFDELVAMAPTDPEVTAQLAKLRVFLGKGGDKTPQLLAADPTLLAQLTDEAVLDPRFAFPGDPQIRKHIEQIREALLCVERGEDDAVGPLLQDIPRTSPLGDWKLLVRGLSAFYLREQERTDENWRRLDPTRPAWRIAQTLNAAANPAGSESLPPGIDAARQQLAMRLQDASLISTMRSLADHWQRGHLLAFLTEFRTLRQLRAKTHAKLIESITDMAWKRAVGEGDEEFLTQLTRCCPAPALDPRWNRAKILTMRGETSYDELPAFERIGLAYAEDLQHVECLPPTERSIASALACQHLARALTALGAEHRRDYAEFGDPEADTADRPFLKAAIRAYSASIKYYNQLESAHLELANVHGKLDEHNKAATVLGKLVAVNPDNFDAHCRLAFYYLDQDEPGKSEPHVAAAVRLHPRDARSVDLRWVQQVTMIRCLVQKRQFAAAEHELDKAATVIPEHIEPYTLPLLRVGLALKAKRAESAEQHLKTALETIEEPTAIWMQMTYVADRFKLPAEVRRDFDRRFKQAIESTPTGPTAARLARFFTMLRNSETNYTGRATQERLFCKYLERANVDEFSLNELQNVCKFLMLLENSNWQLGTQFVAKGIWRFPDSAYLQMLAGDSELLRGPFLCDVDKARKHLQRALELAQNSSEKEAAEIIERAQRGLTLLNSTASFSSRRSYFGDESDEPCNCPECRAERARRADADWKDDDEFADDIFINVGGSTDDDDDDDDDDYDEFTGNPLVDLSAAKQAEVFALLANFANRTPEEIREVFEKLAENGGAVPQPEFLKKTRARASDREPKRRG